MRLPKIRDAIFLSKTPEESLMNKLLVALVSSFFAVASFAASHAGAPMAAASGAKPAASAAKPAASAAKVEKKEEKAAAKTEKKEEAKK